MPSNSDFFDLYRHGFVRVAVATPTVRIGDPAANADGIAELMREAARAKALVCVFPELGLSAYSCEDLFHQQALLESVERAFGELLERTRKVPLAAFVGLPLLVDGLLYNCAALICRGKLLGVTPKTYLPNYREFYELRQFTRGDVALREEVTLAGQKAPFGTDLIFRHREQPKLTLFAEICEDLWVPAPPVVVRRARRARRWSQTSRLRTSWSPSTSIGASSRRISRRGASPRISTARRAAANRRPTSHGTGTRWSTRMGRCSPSRGASRTSRRSRTPTSISTASSPTACAGNVRPVRRAATRRKPLASAASSSRCRCRAERRSRARSGAFRMYRRTRRRWIARCEEVYRIQVQGLATRMRATGVQKLVIGVSGGLDSTQALLVCARAMDELGLPRRNILAYTMPAFATSTRTRSTAWQLMRTIGATAEEIDIRPSCLQMLKDLGHPYAKGRKRYDVTFENVQAGERTSHLFRLANQHGGLVVGTGDLSELALGWCTYGVGDQMSHYAVNASVPKTLIRYLIGWVAKSGQFDRQVGPRARARARDRDQPGADSREQAAKSPRSAPRTSSVRMRCRIFTCTTRCASAIRRRRSRSSRGTHGAARTAIRSPRSASGCACSSSASSRPASSSAVRFRTVRKSARADRSRRAATGALRRTAMRARGSRI
jgi:NAD+ synthase (glutamine-hydrolysing)